jgi:hypothetical protein
MNETVKTHRNTRPLAPLVSIRRPRRKHTPHLGLETPLRGDRNTPTRLTVARPPMPAERLAEVQR